MNGSRVTTLRPQALPDEAVAQLHAAWLENPGLFERLVAYISKHGRPEFGSVTLTYQNSRLMQVEKIERHR